MQNRYYANVQDLLLENNINKKKNFDVVSPTSENPRFSKMINMKLLNSLLG